MTDSNDDDDDGNDNHGRWHPISHTSEARQGKARQGKADAIESKGGKRNQRGSTQHNGTQAAKKNVIARGGLLLRW